MTKNIWSNSYLILAIQLIFFYHHRDVYKLSIYIGICMIAMYCILALADLMYSCKKDKEIRERIKEIEK